MKLTKALEGHNPGVMSISRTILGSWFAFVLAFSIVVTYKALFTSGMLEDIGELFNFLTVSTGIFAGNYVGREGTKVAASRSRRKKNDEDSYE